MNKLMIAVVVMSCAVSVTDLQAMRKRNIIVNNNISNNRPKIETEEEKTITTQCSAILQGVQSNQITQELFKKAILTIAIALKKLKEDKPTVCIKIQDVVKAFCKYLLESIVQAKDKQAKIEEIGIQLIGEADHEDLNENQEDDDKSDQDHNDNVQDPYFSGEYTNAITMFDLLQKLFESLFDDIQVQATDELLRNAEQKRLALADARRNNQRVNQQVQQNREDLEKTIQIVNELNEEVNLQLENVQQDTHEKQQLATRYLNLNQKALQDKVRLNQILNGEEEENN